MALIAVVALTMVLRRAVDARSALSTLRRAEVVLALFAIASVAVGQAWFAAIPFTEWDGSTAVSYSIIAGLPLS